MQPPKAMVQHDALTSVRALLATVRKEVLLISRYPFQLLYWFTCPFFLVLMFYTTAHMFAGTQGTLVQLERLTGDYATYVATGMIIALLFGHTVWQVGYYLRREQSTGTLEMNFILPTNAITLVLGKALAFDLMFSVNIPVILLLSWLFLGLRLSGSISLALLAIALSMVCAFGLGLLFSSLIFLFRRIDNATRLYVSMSYLFSGRSYPTSILPAWLRIVPYVFAVTWSINTIRAATSPGLTDLGFFMAGLTVFSAILVALGYCAFTFMLRVAKRRGGLGAY